MKKFAVLIAVLAVASLAQAGYYLTINGQDVTSVNIPIGSSVTVGVHSTDGALVPEPTPWRDFGNIYHSLLVTCQVTAWGPLGTLSNGVLNTATTGAKSVLNPWEPQSSQLYWSVENPTDVTAGKWFEYTFTNTAGDGNIYLCTYDMTWGRVDFDVVAVTSTVPPKMGGKWYLTVDQGSGHQSVDSITLTTGQTVKIGIWSTELTPVTDTPPTPLTSAEQYGALTLFAQNGPSFGAFSNFVANSNMGPGASGMDNQYYSYTYWDHVTPAPTAAGLWAEWTFTMGSDDSPGKIDLLTWNADYSTRAVWDSIVVNPENWYTARISEIPDVPGVLALNGLEKKEMTIEVGQPVYFQWTSDKAEVFNVEPTSWTQYGWYNAWVFQTWTLPDWQTPPADEKWIEKVTYQDALNTTYTCSDGTDGTTMYSWDANSYSDVTTAGLWFSLRWKSAQIGDRSVSFGCYAPGWSMQYAQEVSLHQIAADTARYPAIDATIGNGGSTVLTWGAKAGAASYKVYFGTDKQAVYLADETSAEYKGTVPASTLSYDAGPFTTGQTYYWRVDVQDALQIEKRGRLCSFSVKSCLEPTDFNHDCIVDIDDLTMLVNDWLKGGGAVTTDLDGNDFVNLADFTLFAADWLVAY